MRTALSLIDAALALEVERVEDLRLHLPLLQGASGLDQTVGERRLPVIDVGDDAEVADVVEFHKGPGEKVRRKPRKIASRPRATNGATGLHPRR